MSILRLSGLSCFLLATLTAQTSGTITGTVTDAGKGVMPGVQVIARGQTLNDQRETRTNSTGQYAFPFLPPGDYELEFAALGFTTVVIKATLSVTERIGVDAVLSPSSVSERVEVSASGALLQTESAALGRVADGSGFRSPNA